jgi:hypothetical protein
MVILRVRNGKIQMGDKDYFVFFEDFAFKK